MAKRVKVTKEVKLNSVKEMSYDDYLNALYDNTVTNIQHIGTTAYVWFPLELVISDNAYQREYELSQNKVKTLAENWDDNKCDPIVINLHKEKKRGCALNGLHRCFAARLNGRTHLPAKIVEGLSDDPNARQVEESILFTDQEKYNERLTIQQKHKGYVLQGRKENVYLDQLMQKYDFEYKKQRMGGKVKAGTLSGFSAALEVTRIQGKGVLDEIFSILVKARWNMDALGLSADIIRTLANLYTYHMDVRKEMKQELINYLRPITPDLLIAWSMERYPMRSKRSVQMTMFLEDMLNEQIGIDRTYTKETNKKQKAANAA